MLNSILALFMFVSAPDLAPYNQVQAQLQRIADEHPDTTELLSIGTSDSGDELYVLKIGNGPTADLVVATHHGNEYGSTAVAMAAAADFANAPIEGHTVYVLPVLNVSGFNNGDRYEETPNGTIDQNRDYPGSCGTEGPFNSSATKALAEFLETANIVNSVTLHTYWNAVLYPYGFSTNDIETAHNHEFIRLSQLAAEPAGYEVGNSKELLYAADGAFEDYAYVQHGIWSLLIEMGDSHNPSQEDIEKMIAGNVPGLRNFFSNGPTARAEDHAFKGQCDRSRVRQRTHLE